MATEPDLETAGYQAWDNLQPLWVAGTLKAKLAAFASGLYATFPEQTPGNHPVVNWLVQISALSETLTGVAFESGDVMRAAAGLVFRICFMTSQLQTQTMITAPQAAAVLAAYNAQF